MRILSKNSLIALTAVATIAGFIYFRAETPSGPGKKGKRYGTVKRGDLVQRVTVSGMVHPHRRTVFVAPYDGYIRKLYVKSERLFNKARRRRHHSIAGLARAGVSYPCALWRDRRRHRKNGRGVRWQRGPEKKPSYALMINPSST